MCVANEDDLSGGGHGTIGGGFESSLIILSPHVSIDPMLSQADWAELQARMALTPDLSLFEAALADGPVETEVDLDDLGAIEDPLRVYGGTSYAVLP